MMKLPFAALSFAFLLSGFSALAADSPYKVGDRVEALPYGKTWYPCTVSEVKSNGNSIAGYGVKCLKPDGTTMEWGVGTGPEYIRPDGGRIAADTQKGIAAAQGQPLFGAPRLPLTCPSAPDVQPGAPSEAVLRRLIQCSWESQPAPREVLLIDIHSMKFGTPRRWNGNSDIGNGVQNQTIVYPVLTKWAAYHYWDSGRRVDENEGVNSCYVNVFKNWQCGVSDVRTLSSKTLQ